jgi:hypothetical protein
MLGKNDQNIKLEQYDYLFPDDSKKYESATFVEDGIETEQHVKIFFQKIYACYDLNNKSKTNQSTKTFLDKKEFEVFFEPYFT